MVQILLRHPVDLLRPRLRGLDRRSGAAPGGYRVQSGYSKRNLCGSAHSTCSLLVEAQRGERTEIARGAIGDDWQREVPSSPAHRQVRRRAEADHGNGASALLPGRTSTSSHPRASVLTARIPSGFRWAAIKPKDSSLIRCFWLSCPYRRSCCQLMLQHAVELEIEVPRTAITSATTPRPQRIVGAETGIAPDRTVRGAGRPAWRAPLQLRILEA